jgi:hypothetical protein
MSKFVVRRPSSKPGYETSRMEGAQKAEQRRSKGSLVSRPEFWLTPGVLICKRGQRRQGKPLTASLELFDGEKQRRFLWLETGVTSRLFYSLPHQSLI